MNKKIPVWCFRNSMYVYSANSRCEECPEFKKCYEYNKHLTKAVKNGKTVISPLTRLSPVKKTLIKQKANPGEKNE